MVALGAGCAALAFFSPDELLEFPMQLLDLPAHSVLVLNGVRGEPSVSITLRLLVVWLQVTVGDDPFNVAVWGDQLEEAHEKRQLFELDACAVQTLSRLNRTHPGKEDTFILDFANEPAEIQASFQPFYEGTTIEEDIDPNLLYDLREKMNAFAVTQPEEIEAFARAFFQPRGASSARNHAALNAAIDPAVERVRAKSSEEQAEYKHLLAAYLRLYSFLSQIMPFTDAELEKFYAYGRLFTTKLRDDVGAERFQLNEEVALEYYRLQKMSEGNIALSLNGDGALPVPSDVGTGNQEREEALLSSIVHDLNKRFGTDFTVGDQLFFEQIEEDLISDRNGSRQFS